MNAGLARLNSLAPQAAEAELLRCCGAHAWARAMAGARPFVSEAALFARAEIEWNQLGREAWLEAFSHHPRIGERARGPETRAWASEEQKGTASASAATLEALITANREYEARFGHVFLVCATGKSADEMLALLRARLGNDPARELAIAAGEQAKITRIRIEKLLKEGTQR